MHFNATPLAGVLTIDIAPHRDERGFFARLYEAGAFAQAGIAFTPADMNLSLNTHRHTLRGLHYQPAPYAEAKLVRAVAGRAYDVVVDLRDDSPTRGQWTSVILDAGNWNGIFVPEGCAHGFLTLAPITSVLYHMGRPYEAGHAAGYRWDDPAFAIDWPAEPEVISDADTRWPAFDMRATRSG